MSITRQVISKGGFWIAIIVFAWYRRFDLISAFVFGSLLQFIDQEKDN